jgi:hypothetical protein
MSDLTKPTQDITIFSEDGTTAVGVIDDAGTKRLAVDANLTKPVGQKAMTASLPVVIASDQTTLPIKGVANVGSAPADPPVTIAGVNATTGFKQFLRMIGVGVNFNLASDISSWFGSVAPTIGQKTKANSIPVTFPSDQTIGVALTGGNLWEYATENGQGYNFTTGVNLLATAVNQPFLLIRNPVASGKKLRIKTVFFSSTANTQNIFNVYRNPTITANGTALTANKMRVSGGNTVATGFRVPTITAFGTLITPVVMIGSPAGSTFVLEFDLGQFIEEGENYLIAVDPSAVNLSFSCTVYYIEV